MIVFEGVNDLGGLARDGEVPPAEHAALVQRVIAAYQQIIARAHGTRLAGLWGDDHAICRVGLLSSRAAGRGRPAGGEQWIRASGHFDAVIDFDAVVRDPQHPDRLLPNYDCGDHLHPSPAGFKAMGEAVSLDLFAR